MFAARLAFAFGFGFTPFGSPKPPAFTVGCDMLFATVVGVSLLKRPSFGWGGGVKRLGGAASTFGSTGVGIFTSAIFGGSGCGFGSTILGASWFTAGGGGITRTFGTGMTTGFGCSTGNTSSVMYLCCSWA